MKKKVSLHKILKTLVVSTTVLSICIYLIAFLFFKAVHIGYKTYKTTPCSATYERTADINDDGEVEQVFLRESGCETNGWVDLQISRGEVLLLNAYTVRVENLIFMLDFNGDQKEEIYVFRGSTDTMIKGDAPDRENRVITWSNGVYTSRRPFFIEQPIFLMMGLIAFTQSIFGIVMLGAALVVILLFICVRLVVLALQSSKIKT
ncbi:MAG: hypothetical protein AAB656_03025 [Patescibacteria group bacterium]